MKKAIISLGVFLFCIALSQNALAKTDLRLTSVGIDAGLVDPEGAGGTLGLGAFADLGTFAPNIRFSSHLGYWSKSEDGGGGEASIRDISVGARVKYMFRVSSPKIQPFAGGGLGLHFFHAEVTVPDMDFGGFVVPGYTAEDSSTELGLDLGGGVVTPLSPKTDLSGELWYTLSDVDQVAVKVGVAFKLSR